MKLIKAKRGNTKLRIGISGASGFGKTYSSLLMAHGLTEDYSKIAIIDSESNSACLYSQLGEFNVINLAPPYSPEKYIEALHLCENAGLEVIIIDSLSHEWNGPGGCLDIHEKLGGRFQDWAKVTPRHQALLDTILSSSCHVICTTRRKTDYSLDVSQNGKSRVVKHGTKEITRDGFEYELTVNLELINENHLAKASKDRTGLFMNKPEFIINEAIGKQLKKWCTQSEDIALVKKEILACETIEGLRHLYQKYQSLKNELMPLILSRKEALEKTERIIVSDHKIIDNNKRPTHDNN
ncbi:AAA family ATPase [Robertkochia flava]|uniref:AAA family ATPase n=1 Tax=Robertkochia flava TaxID=3447986 RepID=UPI001CCF9BC5|nr:AAA family ATPase [Robertkochia marina]